MLEKRRPYLRGIYYIRASRSVKHTVKVLVLFLLLIQRLNRHCVEAGERPLDLSQESDKF